MECTILKGCCHFLTKISLEMHMGINPESSIPLSPSTSQNRACVWGEGMSTAESDKNYQRPLLDCLLQKGKLRPRGGKGLYEVTHTVRCRSGTRTQFRLLIASCSSPPVAETPRFQEPGSNECGKQPDLDNKQRGSRELGLPFQFHFEDLKQA